MDPPAPEVVVGYGLFGGLASLSVWMLRRTREIDRRRDELGEWELRWVQAIAEGAKDERDRLHAEIAALTEEVWRLRRDVGGRSEGTRNG